MTRSSWHYFWIVLTVESLIVFLLFVFAVAGSAPDAASLQSSGAAAGVPYFYVLLAQELGKIAALLSGSVAVMSGSAWLACGMALMERRRAVIKLNGGYIVRSQPVPDGGVDVDFRS